MPDRPAPVEAVAAPPRRPPDRPGRPGVPGSLPSCPEDWTIGPPDFVGVGASRCGTTWWHELIVFHPAVAFAPGAQKETHFFDVHWEGSFGDAEVAQYHEYFPRPSSDVQVGEWSPDYMYHAWIPRHIAAAAPAAKILILLRDPFERYMSDLRHWLMLGGDPANLGNVADLAQFRSCYSNPVRRVLQHFPSDQVLVLQHELCLQDLPGQLRRTYEFLGLPDLDFFPRDAQRPRNATSRDLEVASALACDVIDGFARDAALLKDLVPEINLSVWPSAQPG